MKPLLIIPPASSRLHAIEALLAEVAPPRLADVRERLARTPVGAHDAFAAIPDGADVLALACIRRYGGFGLLGELFTRSDVRLQGHAMRLLQTLLSWFDMTGGRWLYATAPAGLCSGLLENFGFVTLRTCAINGAEQRLVTRALSTSGEPFGESRDEGAMVPLTRAHLPLMVALSHVRSGSDPRVSADEFAVSVESLALELLAQQDAGRCELAGWLREGRLLAWGSLATESHSPRTYAMRVPAGDAASDRVQTALLELAHRKGYQTIDFPLEVAAARS
ncbi:MAG: hypothetical protein ACKVS9_10940 [Phycisphaerae bacterium]